MTSAILFGLASAVLYGATDVAARSANRACGQLRTMLYGQALLTALFSAAVWSAGGVPRAGAWDWAVLLGCDLVLQVATACFYRALAVGRLAAVAPITACYGAVAAGLGLAAGERLSGVAAAGLVLALAGGVAAARPAEAGGPGRSGAGLAVVAAGLYGAGFWVQGRFSVPVFGVLASVWTYYAVGVVALLAVGAGGRLGMSAPRGRGAVLVGATALLGGAGYAALGAGQASGFVGVATALSSVASVVAVVLGRVVVREAMGAGAWFGVVATALGLMALQLG